MNATKRLNLQHNFGQIFLISLIPVISIHDDQHCYSLKSPNITPSCNVHPAVFILCQCPLQQFQSTLLIANDIWQEIMPWCFIHKSGWFPTGKQVSNYNCNYNRFTALWILSGTTQVSRYQKGKTNLEEIASGKWVKSGYFYSAGRSNVTQVDKLFHRLGCTIAKLLSQNMLYDRRWCCR